MESGWSKFVSSLALGATLGAGLVVFLRHPAPATCPPPDGLAKMVQDGDLVFRRGDGLWSRRFAEASPHDQRFSHVGVVRRGAPGQWQVIHASANDLTGTGGVAAEPLDIFLGDSINWELRRPTLEAAAYPQYLRALDDAAAAHTPFDTDFRLDDAERVYCTELIWHAWIAATGTDPIPKKTLWRGKLPIVSIEDLLRLSTPLPTSP